MCSGQIAIHLKIFEGKEKTALFFFLLSLDLGTRRSCWIAKLCKAASDPTETTIQFIPAELLRPGQGLTVLRRAGLSDTGLFARGGLEWVWLEELAASEYRSAQSPVVFSVAQ